MTFLVLIVLIALSLINSAFSQNEEKVDPKVKEKILEGEEARVFIQLKEEKRISSTQEAKDEIIDIIGEEKVQYKFDDALSAVINEKDLKKLEKDTRVESIDLVGVRQILLQESVPIILANTTHTLQQNAFNVTGQGRTICIIDSGVNYTHPALGGCYGNNSITSGCKVVGGWDYCADDAGCTTTDSDPMDMHGHGTHVSGIAAANGTIRGVAPESRVVMLKVCNSSGSCFDDAISSGINWCIGNASTYNISVISMSLGSGLSTGFCNNDPLADEINSAVGNGISVVVATGNSGSSSQISAPACVQNATPVGSIRKDDTTIDYNRNALVQLLGPGVNINSTYLIPLSSTGYAALSGTSMAAPHVAGAIAVLTQFLNITGQKKTPAEIESTLNATGKQIADSSSGLTFSRIHLYDAIVSIDNQAPNVTLISPVQGRVSLDANWSFTCNATDLSLSNVTFFLWNTSSIYNQTSYSATGNDHVLNINITNITRGDYTWNCLYSDENANLSFAPTNFSLSVAGIKVNLQTPNNGNATNTNLTYNCTAESESSYALRNMTFSLWNSTSLLYNETKNVTGTSNATVFSYNFTQENRYQWNCFGMNNNTNSTFASSNYSLIYDVTKPTVNISAPADGYAVTGTTSISYDYNVSDNFNMSTCAVILNGISSASNTSEIIKNQTNSISYSTASGSYTWHINCTDAAGNTQNSSSRSLTVNAEPSSTSNSGGGGGGSSLTQTYRPSSAEVTSGYTKELKKNDKVEFSIFDETGEKHALIVNTVGEDFVNLTLRSEPIIIILGIGQSIKVNLTSAEYYNLYVRLDDIIDKKAVLTIQTIKEEIKRGVRELFEEPSESEEEVTLGPEEKREEPKRKEIMPYALISLIFIGVAVLLIALFDIWYKRKMKEEVIQEIKKELKTRKR